jgi:hypothetical protein
MNKKMACKVSVGSLALCGLLLTAACNKNTEQSNNTTAEQQATPAPLQRRLIRQRLQQ